MKLKLIAILLIIAVFLTACGYIVVEDPNRQTIGSIFFPAAHAEQSEPDAPAQRATPVIEPSASEDEDEDEPEATPPIVITRASASDAEKASPGEATRGEAPAAFEESKPAPLARGAQGEEVKRLQEQLRVYGFLNGSADGVFGAQTEQAVKQAQAYLHSQKEAEAKLIRAALNERLRALREQLAASLNALIPEPPAPSGTPSEPDKSENALIAAELISADTLNMKLISADYEFARKPDKFVADGRVSDELQMYLDNAFEIYAGDMKKGAKGADVTRLQTRLNSMYYMLGGIDGEYGSNTQAAVKFFQKFNGLEQTGVADEKLQRMLFSKDCKLSDYPMFEYKVEISVSKQKVYVYKWNAGAYSKLVKTMICSTGTKEDPTPLGTFKLAGQCGRWYYFKEFECWAQYAYRIYSGILFHSVLYSEKDTSTLRQGSVNALGSRASHGCVRLKVADAKWLYENIPAGTSCRIYD